jgi:hypothetical protein
MHFKTYIVIKIGTRVSKATWQSTVANSTNKHKQTRRSRQAEVRQDGESNVIREMEEANSFSIR